VSLCVSASASCHTRRTRADFLSPCFTRSIHYVTFKTRHPSCLLLCVDQPQMRAPIRLQLHRMIRQFSIIPALTRSQVWIILLLSLSPMHWTLPLYPPLAHLNSQLPTKLFIPVGFMLLLCTMGNNDRNKTQMLVINR